MSSLAIVIPLYNEEACLPELMHELDEVVAQLQTQVHVFAINDGSKDGTADLLATYAHQRDWLHVTNQLNGGHGKAIRTGYDLALKHQVDWIFQCDSDRQIPLKELINLWRMKKHGQAILAVRAARKDPGERLMVSAILRLFLKLLFGVSIRDANCPFRLVPAKALGLFLQHIPYETFAPNVFLSVLITHGMPVQEVFVEHLPRRTGENSINRFNLLKVCFRCSNELFNFWRRKKAWPKLPSTLPSSL